MRRAEIMSRREGYPENNNSGSCYHLSTKKEKGKKQCDRTLEPRPLEKWDSQGAVGRS